MGSSSSSSSSSMSIGGFGLLLEGRSSAYLLYKTGKFFNAVGVGSISGSADLVERYIQGVDSVALILLVILQVTLYYTDSASYWNISTWMWYAARLCGPR